MSEVHGEHAAGHWHGRPGARGAWFHVFPEGRMCSLRRALLLWLIPLFVIVAALSAAMSWWNYAHMVREFMDSQMVQLAQSLSVQKAELMPPPTNQDRIHHWGDYIVQVYDGEGRLVRASWDGLGPDARSETGFADARLADAPWRVYVSPPSLNGRRVQVYQSGLFRAHLAVERAAFAVVPVLVLLPLAIFALWGVARAMSRAVQDIGREAAMQDEHNIRELQLGHVPQEIKPLVMSFNSLLSRLKDAFANQKRFVQDAAHELRTPITAVALQLENVRREVPAAQDAASFRQLQAGVERAQRLVDQLLKLSRQESAPPEAPRSLNLHDQVRESVAALIALADQRRIDLGLREDSDATATLACNPADLRSVLDNLIENALRYTPEGGTVDVHVALEQGRAVIEVADTGPGIPPELMDRVFDRFFRVPGSTARGSGLGLAISQAAAGRCGLQLVLRNRTDRSGLIARVEATA